MKRCWALGMLLLLIVAAPAPSEQPRWTKGQILRMLKGDVPPKRIGELARERGIDFQVTPAIENELRESGATPDLLTVLRELGPRPVAPSKPAQIVVETQPGAQVYLDDIYQGQTSPLGRLVIEAPTPGGHTLRVSMAGKKDYQQPVSILAGQVANIRASLVDLLGSIRVRTLSQAEVRLDEVPRGNADASGQFVMSDIAPGTHILAITAEGKQPFRQAIPVLAGQENAVDAPLAEVSQPSPPTGPAQVFTLRHYGKAGVGWYVNPLTTNPPTHQGSLSIYPGKLAWSEVEGKYKTEHDFVASCEGVTKLTTANDAVNLTIQGTFYAFVTSRGQSSSVAQAIRSACPRLGVVH